MSPRKVDLPLSGDVPARDNVEEDFIRQEERRAKARTV